MAEIIKLKVVKNKNKKQVQLHNYIKVYNGEKVFQFMYQQKAPNSM